MGLQAQYNKEQAKYSTELSKEMWDYTNYENQKKHLEEAGLNPALLYGSSGGGGGSAAGGGNAAGVGLPTSTGVGMGIQWEQMEAQKRKLEADAAKNEADAAKTAGVDTELAKTAAKLNEARIKNANMSTEEIAAKAKMWGDTSTMLWQQARK